MRFSSAQGVEIFPNFATGDLIAWGGRGGLERRLPASGSPTQDREIADGEESVFRLVQNWKFQRNPIGTCVSSEPLIHQAEH